MNNNMQEVHSRVNELLTKEERINFYEERSKELDEIAAFYTHLQNVYEVLVHGVK